MIGPKVTAPTFREEREAYSAATTRDDGRCQRCLRNCGPIARDHRKNRSQGGLTVVENLQLLGLRCHEWKTLHPSAAELEGWAVPGHADPLTTPAARWFATDRGTVRLGWCLYGSRGEVTEIPEDEAESLRFRAGVI